MALAVFPSYVTILLSGYSQKRESALLRTEMDSGPPKQAKVKSRVMITRSAQLLFDNRDELYSFDNWYANDINEGADWFQFIDPVNKKVITARFAEGGYTASPLSGGNGAWTATVKIESWGQ